MTDSCLFCAIAGGDVPSTKVDETRSTYAFMDINPASDGHVLVIPKRHSRDLLDIGADDLVDVTRAAQRIAKATVEVFDADGVNLLNCSGAEAWQSVFHFHLHVVPRYADATRDRLEMPWQPGAAGNLELIAELGQRLADRL